jgi:hypothetical protein
MKMVVSLRIDSELMQQWECIKAAYHQRGIIGGVPSLSDLMRTKFYEVVKEQYLVLKDAGAVNKLVELEKQRIMLDELRDIRRNAFLPRYAKAKQTEIENELGVNHPLVVRARTITKKLQWSRGQHKAAQKTMQKRKAAITEIVHFKTSKGTLSFRSGGKKKCATVGSD